MPRKKKERKIFVLDTSVILYAHNAITNFEEHDVAIPITVLEELDQFKKGNDTKNFEAREFIRLLDTLSQKHNLDDWLPLNGTGKGKFRVIMPQDMPKHGGDAPETVNGHNGSETNGKATKPPQHGVRVNLDATKVFDDDKADHKILNSAIQIKQEQPDRPVILVSKDINLRLKAKSFGLQAEDYETGKIKNVQELFTGSIQEQRVSSELIEKLYENQCFDADELGADQNQRPNGYYILKNGRKSALGYFNPDNAKVERLEKHKISGIEPKNAEQVFAMHALMNPNIRLVTLQGVAGTGKTLLALAAALEQRREFKQIYLARPIVPLSNKDIGFLPGDIKSKLNPYMEPLWDNLKFIKNQYKETDKQFKQINEMVEKEKLLISPLAYIRGRSLSNIYFIIDEAQNLTPHEIKTIITRAGENTKIVFTGDVYQIDTPYLDSQSNGLSYLIDRIKGHPLYAHVTLVKGERSALANLANDLL